MLITILNKFENKFGGFNLLSYVCISQLNLNIMKKLFFALVLLGSVAVFFSSCRTGYGCRGNQSWSKMVRRNNAP
jgi:hypothetical protein